MLQTMRGKTTTLLTSFIKPVAGTAMIFTVGKRSEDSTTGKRNISRRKALLKHDHSSAIADHVKTTGHNIEWDHFDILASGKTGYHCMFKESLFTQDLQATLNANVSSEKLLLY